MRNLMLKLFPALTFLFVSLAQAAPVQGPNGHYYDRIDIGDSPMLWSEARDDAETRSYQGLDGHLATIYNQATNDLILQALYAGAPDDCWFGATDEAVEGEWRWVTGELFWVGAVGGSVQPGMFEAWNNGEPNNSGDEDVAHMFSSGVNAWNDLKTSSTRSCFLVEFPGELVPVPALGPVGLGGLILLLGLLGWRYTRQS